MNTKLVLKKLSWAGVSAELAGVRLVIDGVEGRGGPLNPRLGAPRLPLVALGEPHSFDYALLTHLHKDHFDPDALKRVLREGATLFVPAAVAGDAELLGIGAKVVGLREGETAEAGPFLITAVPAVDGFGAAQCSWVVAGGGRRFFHAGDTLFHGSWWAISKAAAPLDVAFLPINSARVTVPGLDPTGLPGVMTAEQAAVAGRLLKAALVVPIHYQEFHNPPAYIADLDAESSFLQSADREKINARVLQAGDIV